MGTVFVRETPEASKAQWRAANGDDQLRAKLPKLGALMDECFVQAKKAASHFAALVFKNAARLG
jgi:hypothetical protein